MGAEARVAASPPRAAPQSALRVVGWCVAVLLVAAALLPLVPQLAGPPQPLALEVSGEHPHVEDAAIRRAVAPLLERPFQDLDLMAVKAAVEQLPWVARARVDRSWPAQVRVQLWEHQPVARWGEADLLSSQDVVFTPPRLDAGLAALPRLAGPDGQHAVVREAFDALRTQLAGTPFVPVRLWQNARGEWTALTADGIELRLGRGAPTDAVGILAGPARSALEGRLTEVAYVDLHYFNGFAVGWREPVAGEPRSPGPVPEGPGG